MIKLIVGEETQIQKELTLGNSNLPNRKPSQSSL